MTTPTVTETRRHRHQIGERVELARYAISSGERVVYGQRVDGVVRVIDRPVLGGGRSFLVERGLEQDGLAGLNGLVSDYVRQARVHDQVPLLVRSDIGQFGKREADR
jgi:hypothetical protein